MAKGRILTEGMKNFLKGKGYSLICVNCGKSIQVGDFVWSRRCRKKRAMGTTVHYHYECLFSKRRVVKVEV